ncbi:MAG TPA: YpmS family protein [Chondromyces sp.]|nr:YpmS family protein [Chondromyces sp.]
MKNIWKFGFFLLLGINLAVVAVVLIAVFMPMEEEPLPSAPKQEEAVEFQIQSNKEDLNKMISTYIEKEKKKSGPVDYNVILRDEVELYGDVQIFSERIGFKMTFEPQALKNGDVVLKQKGISLGRMKLPVPYIMKIARDSYNFPEWVNIHPNDRMIYVSMNKIEIDNDFKVRADRFNLKEDDIQFTLSMPVE